MVIKLILNVEWGRKLVRQTTEEAGKRRGRFDKEIGTKGATGQQFWGAKDCLLIVRLLWVVIHMLVEDRRRPAGTGDI
jgi:hypothetical protein